MRPKFSILIPAIFERLGLLEKLYSQLRYQIREEKRDDIEIVSVLDNCAVSIGEKRQAVLDCSHGDYVAFVDDDDSVSDGYIHQIIQAIDVHSGVDVITFDATSFIEQHQPIITNMRLGQANEEVWFDDAQGAPRPVIKRGAWHMCAWRSGLAKSVRFPDINYGEDWAWAGQLNQKAKTEHHIDEALHVYVYKKSVSRAT